MRLGIDYRMANNTGIGTYVTNLISEFAKMSNLEIALFTDDSIPIYSLREQIIMPLRIQKNFNAELMFYPHFSSPVLKFLPSVTCVHDLTHLKFPENLPKPRWFSLFYATILIRLSIMTSRIVVTNSLYVKEDILSLVPSAKDKLRVIPLGVDKRFFSPINDVHIKEVMYKYGIFDDYIFYTGMHKGHKNLIRLIMAFKELLKENTIKVSDLVIGGAESQDTKELKKVVFQNGLERYVKFIGYVDNEDLPALYQGAYAFVFPSLSEGFGLPLLEAQASRTPVIAADSTCIPEVVGSGAVTFNGLDITDMANKIYNVITLNKNDREVLITRGYLNAKKYTWFDTAKRYVDVFREVLDS